MDRDDIMREIEHLKRTCGDVFVPGFFDQVEAIMLQRIEEQEADAAAAEDRRNEKEKQ